MKKITTFDFIERATKIYGNKFDYSQSEYVDYDTPVLIVCPLHGEFRQKAYNHLHNKKDGCPICSREKRGIRQRTSLNKFIEKSKSIHQNKYDYSKSVYTTALTPVEIICPAHGSFFQRPNSHLRGQGCKKCGNGTKTRNEFIELSNKVHGNKYDYSGVVYVDLITKVKISCPKHGTFYQTPDAHFHKQQGCPKCKKSKGEFAVEKFLIDNNIKYEAQKYFSECLNPKTGWPLYYDFYLPDKNILIEYDGYQHYQSYHKDGFSLDNLKERQFRDLLKTKWAKKNKITLIRIKYTNMKKIPSIMTNALFH